jgi:N-acetylmuramoyl-L-alanine amidase
MIVVMRKTNVVLVGLIVLLAIALLSLNMNRDDSKAVSTGESAQKTVMLDPGHGGEDPGAVSSYSDLKEKDVNLAIASKVRELLENDGYKVIMTREEDVLEYSPGTPGYTNKRFQDLTRRKKLMDEAGTDIIVSIHLNKFKQTQYYGAQVFYPPESKDSMKLAQLLQRTIRENVDPGNTREALVKKKQPQIIILQNPKTTIAIVECGFLSNVDEEKRLATVEYQGKLAAAIKTGIDRYFGRN